ncbi:carboxylate-amine ligase [Candidatus Solirubrobacter pratensis]|uniref:carboxylate-amine ligase n=1 Tax=Candidatus Solirubrobacter pratensis TaxID=1298857 RepID=UPI0003FA02F0|nr:YbdK family carboxylate-amine ligase [Candidatus Solirubrobacter pratensis]
MSITCSQIAFNRSPVFSVGAEEELLLATPGSLWPSSGAEALLAALEAYDGSVAGEINDAVIELRTPVCRTVSESAGALRSLRAAAGAHAPLLGAGVHPLARFGDVRLNDGERYALIDETMRSLMRQTPHCGVHVHVGMPDAETAIRACNRMREWIPVLQALGANSPFWYGRDSGLDSTRSIICHSFPRSGIPRAFADYDDFAATAAELCALGECPDYTFLWWDVRPHPRLGTLEVRALDAQASIEDLTGLIALVQCLAVHEAAAPARGGSSPEALRELAFRAARDGLDARLRLDGQLRPAREVACHAIALAGAYAADLGCWDELMLVHRILERGNGAQRQRRDHAQGGMRLVLRRLAGETVPEPVNEEALELGRTARA